VGYPQDVRCFHMTSPRRGHMIAMLARLLTRPRLLGLGRRRRAQRWYPLFGEVPSPATRPSRRTRAVGIAMEVLVPLVWMLMFRQFASEDRALSRVGIFFCLAISAVVFFVSVRALPIKQALPRLGGALQVGAKPNANIVIATPTVGAAVQSAPTTVPTVVPVPTSAADVAAKPADSATKPPARSPSAPSSPTAMSGDAKVYTVQAGDTLYGIARNHGATPRAIATLNGMSGTAALKAGQRLLLP
jgi:LysM repeat protein